jgi:hypothetical protein
MAKEITEDIQGLITYVERTYRTIGRLRERLLMEAPKMSDNAVGSLFEASIELERLRVRLIKVMREDSGDNDE